MKTTLKHRASQITISICLIGGIFLSGCNLQKIISNVASPVPPDAPTQPAAGTPLAEVTFITNLLVPIPSGDLMLEILDEVTGLALNPKRYLMEENDDNQFKVVVPVTVGSAIKYRFIRAGTPLYIENDANGIQVRYRMFQVDGPSTVTDSIAGWPDAAYTGLKGRITGQIIDKESNSPIPSALIIAGGRRTITASDGSFALEGLPPGTHNLIVYPMDGLFTIFQQGAMVAENATTPATIYVQPSRLVKVTFVVQIPTSEVKGLPVRIIGSTTNLGNTFADLDGGLSTIASNAPTLSMIADDIYSISLDLPVGLDLVYKYTLGDGFWNSERNLDGTFRLRELIVPEKDLTVTDIVDNWKTDNNAPISFTVTVPENTPGEDVISIQFNPFSWTAPIPMWPLGENQWLYVLYNPLGMFTDLKYRYCRNDLCGIADDEVTHTSDTQGKSVVVTVEGAAIQDVVTSWANWQGVSVSTTIIAPEINPRGTDFMAGIELSPNYDPVWQHFFSNGLREIQRFGANWVIISPSWSYINQVPVNIGLAPGENPSWNETVSILRSSDDLGLQTALYPRLNSNLLANGFWNEPVEDQVWWDGWFDQYQKYIIHFADMAAQNQVPMLVLGGPDVTFALPGGTLQNGDPSGISEVAGEKWSEIISDVRSRYSGKIAWALPYPYSSTPLPEWLQTVDLVYILFSAPLSETDEPNQGELQEAFATMFDVDLLPLSEELGIPLVIGLDYPSANGSSTACVTFSQQCLPFSILNQPVTELEGVSLDLQEQMDIYNAALNAVLPREWIKGFISRGYFSPAALQDTSSSVHGKPSGDVLWYWYPKLLGR